MSVNRFNSKHGAQNMRKQSWACIKCSEVYQVKTKTCHKCHNPVHYFPSLAELRRFRALQLEQRAELISNLELQPPYNVVINGEKICTYKADFKYMRNGEVVVEDVKATKNEKYLDPVFLLKRKLVEAIFKIKIQIVT